MRTEVGICHCGCGQNTRIASRNDKRDGSVKGQPVRYVHGHHRRKSFIEYREEDRGHKTPCWIWQKAISGGTRAGYGHTYEAETGKMRQAHIVYYERKHGKVPSGRKLDHLCRVRPCVNPDHVEPVTDAENVQRGNNAILTPGEVGIIRSIARSYTKRQLSEIYDVSVSNIKMILSGKTWKNVQPKQILPEMEPLRWPK